MNIDVYTYIDHNWNHSVSDILNVYLNLSGNVAYRKAVKVPGQWGWSSRTTVDGKMYHCAQLSNNNPEYCWKVNLKRLYDIEEFIIEGKPSCMYKYYSNYRLLIAVFCSSRCCQHMNLLLMETDFTRTGRVRMS